MDLSEREVVGEPASRHPWERARAEFVIQELKRLGSLTGPVVDIGCGDGLVLSQVRQAFPDIQCFGVDTAFRGQFRCPEGVEIHPSMDSLPDQARPASVVLMMDVLEHLANPQELLTEVRQQGLVSNFSKILVTVPAHQFLFSQQDQWLGHHRRYNLATLSRTLQQANIEILDCRYFFFSLLLLRTLEVALQRVKLNTAKTTGLVRWRGGKMLSRLLAVFLQVDFHLSQRIRATLGLNLPGLSCYGLGRFR